MFLTFVSFASFRTETPTSGERRLCLCEDAGSLTLVVRLTEYVGERVYRMDDPVSGDCNA